MQHQQCLHCDTQAELIDRLCARCDEQRMETRQQMELAKSRKIAMNLTAMAVVLMAAVILIR